MIKFIKKKKVLLLILLLAALLRFWDLSSIPPHLRNDEAALGYNAYSILKTGRDEHGEFLPLIFQSFGDWKMGLYVYLTVPFVALLGLSELAVRFPSAILGVISVWLIYEIVFKMFVSQKIALISALIFSISPVMLAFSRGAWEVNAALTITLLAILCFHKAIAGKKMYLLFSAFFFGLTLLTAHSAKLLSPLIALILFVTYFGRVKKISLKWISAAILIALFFIVPVWLGFSQGKFTRITTLNIFSYYSDPSVIFKSLANRWFSVYSLSALFIKGDLNPQHSAPNMGPLLLMDSLFLLLGITRLIRKGTRDQNIFIWSSLFVLSLPSVLTIENLNFERILPMFIPLIIIISIGVETVFESFKKIKALILIILIFYLLNFLYFMDAYFIHGPKKNDAWQYGYKQIVESITPIESSYKNIIVQQSLEQPYIFFLFYQKFNPFVYQSLVGNVFIRNKEGKDMGLVSGIDNIKFEDIDWKSKLPEKNTIYVLPSFKFEEQSKFFKGYTVVNEIKDLNGFPRFKIIKI